MTDTAKHDAWSAGDSYEHYMGRWSQAIAGEYLTWLGMADKLDWADIGCGTGALTREILARCAPKSVVGVEPSEGFAGHARATIVDTRARFEIGGAEDLPLGDAAVDVATSALAINFVPDRVKALDELQRIVRPGGIVSFYVWDYPGGGMGFIDAFWKAAAELDPAAKDLDEGRRFPFCSKDGLSDLCTQAGVQSFDIDAMEVETAFPTFDDFLHPFTLGAGPAPGYYVSLDAERQEQLKSILKRNVGGSEPVTLGARALAVRWEK